MQTHYEVLKVTPSASLEEITRAYREEARKCHPDLGGSVDEIAELNTAVSVLRDPIKRRQYDKHLNALLTTCKNCKGAGRETVWRGQSVVINCTQCQGRGYVD